MIQSTKFTVGIASVTLLSGGISTVRSNNPAFPGTLVKENDLIEYTDNTTSGLLTEDPIFVKNQNFIAKFLISRDRGMNVRTEGNYINLIKINFKKIKSKITHQFFIPYTWHSMICKK